MADRNDRQLRKGRALRSPVGIVLLVCVVLFCFLYIGVTVINYAAVISDQKSCADATAVHDTAQTIRGEEADFWAVAQRAYADSVRETFKEFGVLARPVEVIAIAGKTAHLKVASDMSEDNTRYAQVWLPVFKKYHPQLHESCTSVLISTPTKSYTQTFGNGPYL